MNPWDDPEFWLGYACGIGFVIVAFVLVTYARAFYYWFQGRRRGGKP